jgi:hypothetical protein
MPKLLFRIGWVFLLLGACGGCCYAQFSGNVQGVVSDPSGAPIAGASVRLRNADTGIEQNTTTTSSGNYRFSSLEPGHYLVTAARAATTTPTATIGTCQILQT